MTYQEMAKLQAQSYAFKIRYAEMQARDFYNDCHRLYVDGKNRIVNFDRQEELWDALENGTAFPLKNHISVGGLDSITLLCFLRDLGYSEEEIPAVSVSSLEDKGNQDVHKKLGVIPIKPYKSKVQVIREFGFPVISKAKAKKISYLQNPDSEKQTFIHAIMTGDMGEQGHFEHSDKIKLPDKWLKLFGGNYQSHRPDIKCLTAPFKVGSDCCLWMKEKPSDDWAKAHHSVPYLGLMASEGGQREHGLVKNGCNYFGKSTIRSCPFNIFTRDDLLHLAVDLKVPVPKAYGKIVYENGHFKTTRAQRTGCSMCGFGIHIEKRPHRFDRLREDNPKEWHFWMYECCTDEKTGEKYGWGRVLDWIGVPWEDEYIDWRKEQTSLFDKEDV